MDTDKSTMYLFGFEPAEVERFGSELDLNPVSLTDETLDTLPADTPLVVHARQAALLTHIFEESGVANDAILYLPTGTNIPAGTYFEATVTESQLRRLKQLLEHPQQLRIARLAESVSLQLLTKPVQSLDLQQLGLPAEDSAHLATCLVCPPLLSTALRDRIRLYQQIACPSPEELIELAQGTEADPQTQEHIKECPLCEAQIWALKAAIGVAEPFLALDEPINYTQKGSC